MKKILFLLMLFIAGTFSSQALATTIPLLYFSPVVSSIYVGDTLDVDARIKWLDCETDVGAFDFDVKFNDSVLAFDSYTLTDNLGDLSAFEAVDWSWGDSGSGSVNIAEVSFLKDFGFQDDSFTLATLSFTGIGAGTSLLSFGSSLISDAWGEEICTWKGLAFTKVKAVPEPATLLLFGTGLVGFSIMQRKRRKA